MQRRKGEIKRAERDALKGVASGNGNGTGNANGDDDGGVSAYCTRAPCKHMRQYFPDS
jgi:hypothetical protein